MRKCNRFFRKTLAQKRDFDYNEGAFHQDKEAAGMEEKEMVFLAEFDPIQGGMLEEVLDGEGIPFAKQHVSGIPTAFTHSYFGVDKFFVSEENLSRARELVDEMFGENE